MKVLIISRGYPTEKYPMNGIFEFDQAKALANLGHEVIFASLDMRSFRRKRKWWIEKFEKDGVYVYGINIPLGRIPKRILSYCTILALKRLYKEIEKDKGLPDIIHAHFTGIGYAATKLKDKIQIPLIITEHSSEMMKSNIGQRLFKLASKTYWKADKVIAVSPALSKVIKANFNIDSIYIPNVVDTNTFTYSERYYKKDFTFITVGNLIYRKRMDLTVLAFCKSFPRDKNVKLVVIGDGEERENIESIIKKYKFEDKIILTGRLYREQISEYMKKSDCFVLSSRAETFGVVYIEAMAVGLPIIATKCGGPEYLVNEKNGLLIEIDDLEQLIEAMKRMYKHKNHYDRQAISQEIHRCFSPKNVAKEIETVYNNIL